MRFIHSDFTLQKHIVFKHLKYKYREIEESKEEKIETKPKNKRRKRQQKEEQLQKELAAMKMTVD